MNIRQCFSAPGLDTLCILAVELHLFAIDRAGMRDLRYFLTMATALWVWIVVIAAAVPLRESPGRLLAPGTQLVYSSGGQENPPWRVEAIARDTALGAIRNCSVIRLRTSPSQSAPEVRAQCERGDTLFAWDAGSGSHRPMRPVAAGMSLQIRGSRGTITTYETGSNAVEIIGTSEVPVIATVVTTRDSTGRVIRRLRERFSLALATATGGVFEVPDSTSADGWRVERKFDLTRIER